jgi:hypothetical protein
VSLRDVKGRAGVVAESVNEAAGMRVLKMVAVLEL